MPEKASMNTTDLMQKLLLMHSAIILPNSRRPEQNTSTEETNDSVNPKNWETLKFIGCVQKKQSRCELGLNLAGGKNGLRSGLYRVQQDSWWQVRGTDFFLKRS